MHTTGSFLHVFKQNNALPIRIITPSFGHLSPEVLGSYGLTHRKAHYFFLFMLEGLTRHRVDLQQFDVSNGELLFIVPNQIHELPTAHKGTDYYKLGFDEDCLALLPKQYPFLVNPLNDQKIRFTRSATSRIKGIFGMLVELLREMTTPHELVIAHLNSLLTEINEAYFSGDRKPADHKLSKYIGFKLFVENNLTDHLPISDIAVKLTLNTNSLYNIVKYYSGRSPKEFITDRLVLEAKRRLYYSESSIKELAYDLGFNDPEYFARLFKKNTGKTITMFAQDLSGN